ncbi:Methyltransferase domain-containing protein [Enhydrobacter aerosaccus]|uniref:Methyltransferase domain-containing protein n=1 Tax=Enhydrobacter aerosaccus TaxID=225324 RepID=A0A1T4TJU5_9HYPH|nr:DUF4942 domain-containing protein [Enhydrobacter aerosaccus]SKA40509.1 Methyltransferase domain-containing protein [Enhydrobacter aerosaccus]
MDNVSIYAPGEDTDAATPNAILPRATIRDMCRRRQHALDLFGQAFTVLTTAAEALDQAKAAFFAIDQRGRSDRFTHFNEQEQAHFLAGLEVPELETFTEAARKMVDRRMWAVLVEMTDLERLMDKQAKDQLHRQLQEEVPEAIESNVYATLQQLMLDADVIFKRGIANCFTSLDRRFRSHDGWKIGSRVILSRAFGDTGHWNFYRSERDTLHDIDRTFNVLDGRQNPHLVGGIVHAVEQARQGGWGARQTEVESDYFKVRVFMNGNLHIWFKRDDLVEKVNALLGEYYGAPIPEDREPDPDTGLHDPKTSLAKRYGFYPTPDDAAQRFFNFAPLWRRDEDGPLTILEPSAGTGNLAGPAAKRGHVVDCVEYQPALAEALKVCGLFRRVQCIDFLALKPNPGALYDRVLMNPPFDRERDIDHVLHALEFLKPDGCLVAIMSAGTEFRETRKSIAFRALMESMNAEWEDLPAGSFASVGTYANTRMLRVWKDGRSSRRW